MSGTAAAIGGALLSGGASLLGSISSGLFAQNINERNIEAQKETNAHNEALMREAWARDDTARQRMVKDLEAAGLSKWLATGASPMNSSPVSLQAPKADKVPNLDFGAAADRALAAYGNMIHAEETKAQTALLEQQRLAVSADTRTKEAQAKVAEHDADVLTARAGASSDPAYIKYLDEGLNTLSGESPRSEQILPAVKTILSAATGNPTVDPVQAAQVAKQILNSEPVKAAKKMVSSGAKKVGSKVKSGAKKVGSTLKKWGTDFLNANKKGQNYSD